MTLSDEENARWRKQVAYKFGSLKLSYDLAEALEFEALKRNRSGERVNVTGDTSAWQLIRVTNLTDGSQTSVRWEFDGIAISRPSVLRQFLEARFDVEPVSFVGKTIQQCAEQIMEVAMGETIQKVTV